MRSNNNETMAKEVRAALDNPRARHLVVGALLMRENRKGKPDATNTQNSPNSDSKPARDRR